MSEAAPDFAGFPRQRLALHWNRRQMLTLLGTEVRLRSQTGGAGRLKIPDLGTFPDDILELMTPRLASWYVLDSFPPPFATAVALMQHGHTLHAVAEQLRISTGWEGKHAFRYVRGVFLHLVSRGLCLPAG